jgi:hypothetical protein
VQPQALPELRVEEQYGDVQLLAQDRVEPFLYMIRDFLCDFTMESASMKEKCQQRSGVDSSAARRQ